MILPVLFQKVLQQEPLTISGTNKNDILVGTNFKDVIKGLKGKDKLYGKEGDDEIYGEVKINCMGKLVMII